MSTDISALFHLWKVESLLLKESLRLQPSNETTTEELALNSSTVTGWGWNL